MKLTKIKTSLVAVMLFAFGQASHAQYGDVVEGATHYPSADGIKSSKEPSDKPPKKENVAVILSSSRYKTGRIMADAVWFERKVGETRQAKGIIKDGEMLLPDLFNKGSYSLSASDNGDMFLTLGGKTGLYNLLSEKWILPLEYESLSKIGTSGTLYLARKSGKQGVIDAEGDEVIGFNWDRIESISNLNNYFIVKNKGIGSYNYKYGIYNILTKSLIIPCEYDELNKIYSGNLFKVKKEDAYNILNIKNELQFKNWYDKLNYIDDGRGYFIVQKDEKSGVVDRDNNEIIPITYKRIDTYAFSDGSYLAQNAEGKFGCMRIDGSVTLPFIYDNLKGKDSNGNMVSSKGEKCGMIKVNSGLPYELATCDYDNIEAQRKIYIVQQKGKYAILDKFGKLVTGLDYDNIKTLKKGSYSSEGLFLGEKAGKQVLLSESGRKITEDEYNEISIVSSRVSTSSYYYDYSSQFNYLKYKEGKKYGLIDAAGVVILKPIFDDIIHERNNVLVIKKKNKIGLYDMLKGKELVSANYDSIVPVEGGFVGIKGSSFSLITNKNTGVVITDY